MMKNSSTLCKIVEFIDDYCGVKGFADYPPAHNGLQFENSGKVARIAAAVDAGLAEIELASHLGANLLIVHHGLFWEPPIPMTGANYAKIKTLVDSDIAVYSMHMPLDAHVEVGNNTLLAKCLNLKILGRCFEYEGNCIGVVAETPKGGIAELCTRLKGMFPSTYKDILFGSTAPKKVAICSGSCSQVIPLMPEMGVDTLICGELRQRCFTMAQELRLNLFPCGHYATEKFGTAALGELVAKKFSLKCDFIEMGNPL